MLIYQRGIEPLLHMGVEPHVSTSNVVEPHRSQGRSCATTTRTSCELCRSIWDSMGGMSHGRIHGYINTYTYIHIYIYHIYTYIYIYTYTYTHSYKPLQRNILISVYTYISIYICTWMNGRFHGISH